MVEDEKLERLYKVGRWLNCDRRGLVPVMRRQSTGLWGHGPRPLWILDSGLYEVPTLLYCSGGEWEGREGVISGMPAGRSTMPNIVAPPRCIGCHINGGEALQLHREPALQTHEKLDGLMRDRGGCFGDKLTVSVRRAETQRQAWAGEVDDDVGPGPFAWPAAAGHIVTALCLGGTDQGHRMRGPYQNMKGPECTNSRTHGI